ncbi:MAG: TlpA family protein disulfide reductase [Candidatus Zixiibacteriota bacterium]|nr:MAG: TlpA family protein disulfide reductase [candidate division Zixibacteria bacterium]
MLRKLTTFMMLPLVAMFLMISCGGESQSENNIDDATTPEVAETPAVESEFLFTAYDVYGKVRNSSEWVGKQPVVINFWGTWCPPCRREIPDLVRVYNELQSQGIEMIGLAVNDTPEKVTKFAEANGMNWVMLMGDRNLGIRYKITGVPTTIFIGRDGKELGRFVGPRDYDTFKEAFLLALQT